MIVIIFAAMALSATDLADASSASQSPQDARELATGEPIEREIAGGETHAYRLVLAAHQFLRISVNQREVDVAVSALGSERQSLVEADNRDIIPLGGQFSLVTEAMGDYTLEVRALKKDAARGRYQVQIEELRGATPQDLSRVAAER